MFRSEPFEAKLVSARMLSPFVRELVLEREDGGPFQYAAGQWVNLVLPLESGEVKRAYSVASAPVAASSRFEIAVTKVSGGAGSQYLHDLEIGSKLRAIGPQGLFTRAAEDEAPALFVATGTGITPLRAMLQAAIAEVKVPLWLLFGARVEADVLYRDEFEKWTREVPGFRYEVTLSQPSDAWTGRRGYVQEHVTELLGALREKSTPATPHLYVCGLERMVKAVRDLARENLAVDRKHVHTERYD
jgi:CDP-4-dehydro-6-deoxyglucose reductase